MTHAKNNSNTGESLLFRKSEDPRLQELNDRLTRSVLANAVQSDTSNFVSSDGSDGILANCNARITFKDK
ncbi:hypothetical protein [Xanthomonas perforans]|uniref:hypothetical protein n=1 Tax=Xanthomonas perforans TaxID=442694 RepID=UPI0023594BD0|nr:hypothetical protein [Xanthomonas perforans]